MELRQLRYFSVLAEILHFGLAAERLNIVQPALSMQIRKLEEELGVVLLARTRRKVELTQAGRLFLEEARRSLAHADRARDLAKAAEQGMTGQLRLGISAAAVRSGDLRRLVHGFRETRPDLMIEPVEVHPARAPEAVMQGDLDAALVTVAPGGVQQGLEFAAVSSDEAALVLPTDHVLAGAEAVRSGDLQGETFVGFAGPDDVSGMSLTARVLGYLPERYRTVSSPSMTVGLVAAGFGVAIVPASMARPEEGAVFRRLAGRAQSVEIALLWQTSNAPVAQAITACLRDVEGLCREG